MHVLTNVYFIQSNSQPFIAKLIESLHEMQCEKIVGEVKGDLLPSAIGTPQHILCIQVILKKSRCDYVTCSTHNGTPVWNAYIDSVAHSGDSGNSHKI